MLIPEEMPPEYWDAYMHLYLSEWDDEPGTVRWFGQPWPSASTPAPVCRPDTHVALPEGTRCASCHESLGALDRGVAIPELVSQGEYHYYGLGCWLVAMGLTPKEMTEHLPPMLP